MDPYLQSILSINWSTTIALSAVIIVLLCCSAFFSCSETAFTTVSNLRLRSLAENKVKGARKAVYVSENYKKTLTYDTVLGNIFIGYTIFSFLQMILLH